MSHTFRDVLIVAGILVIIAIPIALYVLLVPRRHGRGPRHARAARPAGDQAGDETAAWLRRMRGIPVPARAQATVTALRLAIAAQNRNGEPACPGCGCCTDARCAHACCSMPDPVPATDLAPLPAPVYSPPRISPNVAADLWQPRDVRARCGECLGEHWTDEHDQLTALHEAFERAMAQPVTVLTVRPAAPKTAGRELSGEWAERVHHAIDNMFDAPLQGTIAGPADLAHLERNWQEDTGQYSAAALRDQLDAETETALGAPTVDMALAQIFGDPR